MIMMALQRDTIDLICQRVFGFTQGITEQVIELNPKLLAEVHIAEGTPVVLPDKPQPTNQTQTINLWD